MLQAMTRVLFRWCIAAVILMPGASEASTIINGGNVNNATWTVGGSPYIVLGDVTVPAGSTLTIEPGVEVQFASSDSTGAGRDAARVELNVQGALIAQGGAAAPIKFKGQSVSPGSWYGIICGSGAVAVTLSHGVIEHALNGLLCESSGNTVQVENIILASNVTAVAVNNGAPVLNRVRGFGNQTALHLAGSGGASLSYSAIHGSSVQAIRVTSSAPSSLAIDHCTLHGNGTYGIVLAGTSSATVYIKNSIITGNAYGVYRSASAAGMVDTRYSDVWNNSSNFVNAVAGPSVISADPLYVDSDGADNLFGNADDNLHLRPDSPCGNRADDGTDIGAYVIEKVVITGVEFIGNDVRVSFVSVSNKNHQLESTDDFAAWTAVGSGLQGGGVLAQTNFGVRALPARFYRVRVDY